MGGERIEKRKTMNLSISCDHRVVGGYDAAALVQEVRRLLETPVLLPAGLRPPFQADRQVAASKNRTHSVTP